MEALFAELYNNAYTLVVIWFTLVTVIFLALVVRYTFGVGFSEENPNPYQKETFAMPRGVFRGFLTLSLLFVVSLIEVANMTLPFLDDNGSVILPETRHPELLVAFQMMLAFYFGSKVLHHVTSADERKSKEIATSIAQETKAKSELEESGSVG